MATLLVKLKKIRNELTVAFFKPKEFRYSLNPTLAMIAPHCPFYRSVWIFIYLLFNLDIYKNRFDDLPRHTHLKDWNHD